MINVFIWLRKTLFALPGAFPDLLSRNLQNKYLIQFFILNHFYFKYFLMCPNFCLTSLQPLSPRTLTKNLQKSFSIKFFILNNFHFKYYLIWRKIVFWALPETVIGEKFTKRLFDTIYHTKKFSFEPFFDLTQNCFLVLLGAFPSLLMRNLQKHLFDTIFHIKQFPCEIFFNLTKNYFWILPGAVSDAPILLIFNSIPPWIYQNLRL